MKSLLPILVLLLLPCCKDKPLPATSGAPAISQEPPIPPALKLISEAEFAQSQLLMASAELKLKEAAVDLAESMGTEMHILKAKTEALEVSNKRSYIEGREEDALAALKDYKGTEFEMKEIESFKVRSQIRHDIQTTETKRKQAYEALDRDRVIELGVLISKLERELTELDSVWSSTYYGGGWKERVNE